MSNEANEQRHRAQDAEAQVMVLESEISNLKETNSKLRNNIIQQQEFIQTLQQDILSMLEGSLCSK